MTGYRWHVGIDWGTQSHQVCVHDEQGGGVVEREVEHSGGGLKGLCDWLAQISGGATGEVAVAIEVPRGAVVETLVERGFHVFAINPKQLDRFRDRHSVAGAKDDRRDAFVLADSVRTDLARFRRVRLDDPKIIQLRELSRIDDELGEEKVRLANRLRDLVHRYYPQMLSLCEAADEPWFWGLLELAPTPAQGVRLRHVRVQRLLREHRIRRLGVDEVLAVLRAPAMFVAPGTVEAASEHVALLLPRIRLVHQQQRRCLARIDTSLDELEADSAEKTEHRDDVRILRSQPGLGREGVAAMLAEAAEPLQQRDYHALRTRSGVAPVTHQTGKQGKVRGHTPRVVMRQAVQSRLRQTLFNWAYCALRFDPRAKAHYATLRARGHNHGRALRGVGDRLLARLVVMLANQTPYDPTHAVRGTEAVAHG